MHNPGDGDYDDEIEDADDYDYDVLDRAYQEALSRRVDISPTIKRIIEPSPAVGPRPPTTDFQPRIPTRLKPVVDEKMGAIVLGRSGSVHKKYGKRGLMDIGTVCEHQTDEKDYSGYRILMDMLFPHVMFICGKRGSGKSYTLGIVAEELSRNKVGIGTIIIDPIGIFWSLREKNENQGEVDILHRWGLEPQGMEDVRVFMPLGFYDEMQGIADEPFSIAASDLTVEDWCAVFDIDRFKAQGLLIGEVLEKIKHGYTADVDGEYVKIPPKTDNYSIGDIIQCIEYDVKINSREEGYASATRRSIIARFKAASSWGIFSITGTPISQLSYPNRISVIDVSHPKLGEAKRALIAGIIARKIFEARMATSRKEDRAEEIRYGSGTNIPVTWLLIDEAHLLLPHSGKTSATESLVEYAKLGRKPGCALVLATQRPSATNDDILSQTDIIIGHNLALEDDMAALRRRIPAKIPAIMAESDFIRALPVGLGIIADQKTQERALLAQLRPRLSHHSGKAAMPGDAIAKASIEPAKEFNPNVTDMDVSKPTTVLRPGMAEGDDYTEEEAGDEGNDAEAPPLLPGSMVLIEDRKGDHIFQMARTYAARGNVLVVCRSSPNMVRKRYGLPGNIRVIWLSNRQSEKYETLSPSNLGKIAHTLESFMGEHPEGVIFFEGLEVITNNNEFKQVMRFIEAIHEDVASGDAVFVLTMNPEVFSDSDRARLETEADDIVKADEAVTVSTDGSVSGEEEAEAVEEIEDTEEESSVEAEEVPSEHESIEEAPTETDTRPDEESETVRMLRDLMDQVSSLQSRIEELDREAREYRREAREREEARVEKEKKKVEREKQKLQKKIEIVKAEAVEKGEIIPVDFAEAEVIDTEVYKPEKKGGKKRKQRKPVKKDPTEVFTGVVDVVSATTTVEETPEKRGDEWGGGEGEKVKAFRPRVGESEALATVRKELKKSLFGKALEAVDDIELIGMPVYLVLLRVQGGFLRREKNVTIAIDGITGELILDGRKRIKRSRGVYTLYRLKKNEIRVVRELSGRKGSSIYDLSNRLKLTTKTLKKHLNSLEKEGLLSAEEDEDGTVLYRRKFDLDMPSKLESLEPELPPYGEYVIDKVLVTPVIDEKDIRSLVGALLENGIVLGIEMVYYPYWRARVSGKDGRRDIFVDGVNGVVDREAADARAISVTIGKGKRKRK